MRNIIDYNEDEKRHYTEENNRLLNEIKSNTKGNIIYPEQEICGNTIVDIFSNDLTKINILVCGKTQTGKTGCMLAVIKFIMITGTTL